MEDKLGFQYDRFWVEPPDSAYRLCFGQDLEGA